MTLKLLQGFHCPQALREFIAVGDAPAGRQLSGRNTWECSKGFSEATADRGMAAVVAAAAAIMVPEAAMATATARRRRAAARARRAAPPMRRARASASNAAARCNRPPAGSAAPRCRPARGSAPSAASLRKPRRAAEALQPAYWRESGEVQSRRGSSPAGWFGCGGMPRCCCNARNWACCRACC